jgi:hypothetical protein
MTSQRINLLCKSVAAVLTLIAAIVVVGAFIVPLRVDTTSDASGASSERANASGASDLPPLTDFEALLSISLRGQNSAPSTQPALATASGTTLVGTVGDRIALVRGSGSGEVEARMVGERFDGVELVAVRAGEADMRTADGIVTLKKQPDEQTPEYIHRAANP